MCAFARPQFDSPSARTALGQWQQTTFRSSPQRGFSAAALMLCAAGYALLLALGRACDLAVLRRVSLLAYAGVVLAAVALC